MVFAAPTTLALRVVGLFGADPGFRSDPHALRGPSSPASETCAHDCDCDACARGFGCVVSAHGDCPHRGIQSETWGEDTRMIERERCTPHVSAGATK